MSLPGTHKTRAKWFGLFSACITPRFFKSATCKMWSCFRCDVFYVMNLNSKWATFVPKHVFSSTDLAFLRVKWNCVSHQPICQPKNTDYSRWLEFDGLGDTVRSENGCRATFWLSGWLWDQKTHGASFLIVKTFLCALVICDIRISVWGGGGSGAKLRGEGVEFRRGGSN